MVLDSYEAATHAQGLLDDLDVTANPLAAAQVYATLSIAAALRELGNIDYPLGVRVVS